MENPLLRVSDHVLIRLRIQKKLFSKTISDLYLHINCFFYSGGVFSDDTCTGEPINHAIVIIGWGRDPDSGKDYWIIRNSWDTWWGMSGYGWIERGVDMCNIESNVYYVVTEKL